MDQCTFRQQCFFLPRSGNNNNNNNSGRRSLFGQSSWLGSGIGLGLAHRHKRGQSNDCIYSIHGCLCSFKEYVCAFSKSSAKKSYNSRCFDKFRMARLSWSEEQVISSCRWNWSRYIFRLEILMREYLSKITTSQDKKDKMLLSGDWTDSALREATVKSEQNRYFPATTVLFLQTSGPFSGVAGWREMQGGAGLPRGTISARFTQIYHLPFISAS